LTLRNRLAAVPTNSTRAAGAKLATNGGLAAGGSGASERENHAAPAETVKSNREPPVTKSGKSNPKQVKKVEIVDAQ